MVMPIIFYLVMPNLLFLFTAFLIKFVLVQTNLDQIRSENIL